MQQEPGRVAMWHIFEPKIPIWVNFEGPFNGRPFGISNGYLVYVMAFCIFYGYLVCCTKKNLATLEGDAFAPWLSEAGNLNLKKFASQHMYNRENSLFVVFLTDYSDMYIHISLHRT
jgi:hypothetical protein